MNRRFALAASAVLCLSGLLAATPAVGATSDVRVIREGADAKPGNPVDVLDNYAAFQALAEENPRLWGGAYVDGDFLVIKYAGQSEDQAQTALLSAGVVQGTKLIPTPTNLSDLRLAQDAVNEALRGNAAAVSWGPDYSASSLLVSTTEATDTIMAALRAMPQVSVPIQVVEGQRKASLASRYYDTRPYYGGNLIETSNSGSVVKVCSTGFNLTGAPDGYAYAVTAGHCYREGSATTYPNVGVMRNGTPDDYSSGMGTIWTVSTSSNGTMSTRHGDLAIYRYTPISGIPNSAIGAGTVFTGDGNTTSASNVKSTSELPQNYQSPNIRTSGASGWKPGLNTGMISPDWVHYVDMTVNYPGFPVTDMTDVEDASECVSGGDSGGAVYLNVSGGVNAVGIVSGTDDGGGGLSNCRNYYTPVKYIYFGGSIKTL